MSNIRQQRLAVHRRSDLQIEMTGDDAHPCWTVKDPLSLRYFQLHSADWFVFQQLDGTSSIDSIQRQFCEQFAPEKISARQIISFIEKLWQQGIVTVDKFGLTENLITRAEKEEQQSRSRWWSNVLAIRFRGVDPDRLLNAFLPWTGWLFSPVVVIVWCFLVLNAAVLVMTEWDALARELPRVGALFQQQKFLWFLITIATVKAIHELGHAIACKKFGGECRELGVMLLALTPCLYCNVSDAWLLKNRWHRIAISAAGIYVELALAAVCTFLWWWSVPGVVHSVCLYVMIVSSVNTIFLNGNPLLRYDGYYILSDLINVPNLRSRAQSAAGNFATYWGLGVSPPTRKTNSRTGHIGLLVYGILSTIYLWLVLFGILWMLCSAAKVYGAEALVVAIGSAMILSRCYSSLSRTTRLVTMMRQSGQLSTVRCAIVTGLFILVGAVVLQWQISRSVTSPAIIAAGNQETVFVSVPGTVYFDDALQEGTMIEQGDVVARLENHELEMELLVLQGKVARYESRLELLKNQRSQSATAASAIPTTRATLQDFQQQYQQKQTEAKRLLLTAPNSGKVQFSSIRNGPRRSEHRFERSDDPLSKRSSGAWLDSGESAFQIVSPDERDATLYVDQNEVTNFSVGDSVRLTASQTGSKIWNGTITQIESRPVESVPPLLAALNSIPVSAIAGNALRPESNIHEVRVRLASATDLIAGQPAQARIDLGKETVWSYLKRTARRTLIINN